MYVNAGGACANVRVPVYLVVYVYYMTPFDVVSFVYSLNITVIIVKSVFLYYDLFGYFVTLLYASISPFRSSFTPAIGCV